MADDITQARNCACIWILLPAYILTWIVNVSTTFPSSTGGLLISISQPQGGPSANHANRESEEEHKQSNKGFVWAQNKAKIL